MENLLLVIISILVYKTLEYVNKIKEEAEKINQLLLEEKKDKEAIDA